MVDHPSCPSLHSLRRRQACRLVRTRGAPIQSLQTPHPATRIQHPRGTTHAPTHHPASPLPGSPVRKPPARPARPCRPPRASLAPLRSSASPGRRSKRTCLHASQAHRRTASRRLHAGAACPPSGAARSVDKAPNTECQATAAAYSARRRLGPAPPDPGRPHRRHRLASPGRAQGRLAPSGRLLCHGSGLRGPLTIRARRGSRALLRHHPHRGRRHPGGPGACP